MAGAHKVLIIWQANGQKKQSMYLGCPSFSLPLDHLNDISIFLFEKLL